MYLLKRTVSSYTAPDQCLGIFRDVHEVHHARNQYITDIQNGVIADPFAEQAYYTVNLEADIEVISDIPVMDVDAESNMAFVVSSLEEAFGQVLRAFEAICGSQTQAQLVSAVIEARESDFAISAHIQSVCIGHLSFDTIQ